MYKLQKDRLSSLSFQTDRLKPGPTQPVGSQARIPAWRAGTPALLAVLADLDV
jgi:hypothetical protein